ncbi:MAG: SPOR domain-containing protein [Pseudomonadales bacterium]|nr:SPOR domain-containing protein [Pseudomonadales bacterium]
MTLTSIENRMTHDFATVPRYVEPLGAVYKNSTPNGNELDTSVFPVNSPFQLRWILVVLLCLILWFFVNPTSHTSSDVIPDQGEVVEYQQEMEEAYLIGDVKDANESISIKAAEAQVVVETQKVEIQKAKVQKAKPVEVNDVNAKTSSSTEIVNNIVDYGFYDNLRNSQWAVQTQNGTYVSSELAARKKSKYNLQAASFRGAQDAKRLVKKLSKYGLKARSHVSISTNGAEWYQVSVGPFSNVSKMNKAQDILVSLNTVSYTHLTLPTTSRV